MKLLSVNVGSAQPIRNGKPTGTSGIFKTSTTEPVQIHPLGVEGDTVVDTHNHGGVDQAVYVFGSTDYAWWSQSLGRDLAPGIFGENLTISNLESASLHIGDRLHVGTVLLEVTAPRIPCATLAVRMDDPQFLKRFRRAERPGVYCRIIEPGVIQAGDPVTLELYQGDTITALEMFRLHYEPYLEDDTLRFLIAIPAAVRARTYWESLLAERA